jgi:hypothetical protein
MSNRIYKLLTGHYVNLASILELRPGNEERDTPGSELSFGIQYEFRNEPVWFSLGFMGYSDFRV